MEIPHTIRLASLAIAACTIPCFATSVGVSTVEQPVNLVTHSDPTRIPLGRVAVVSNHDYGIHHKIIESRPSPQGAMKWKNGSELDQNLASVFGLSIEIEDSTEVLSAPVIIRLKAWKPPEYSPYTKEQVLAATIWCLIRSTYSRPERPLEVNVIAEGTDDKALETKYSGKYFRFSDEDKKIAPTSSVGGTIIEKDPRGIAWVILPNVAQDKSFKPLSPAMIICENLGDTDYGWHLLPVWGNGESSQDYLELNHYSVNMVYSAWGADGLRNANTFINQDNTGNFTVLRSETSIELDMGYQSGKPEPIAANILALIISTQPTAETPLVVSFDCGANAIETYSAFRKANGWKETPPHPNQRAYYELKCEFVWDPKTHKLIKGSIPLVTTENSVWITPLSAEE